MQAERRQSDDQREDDSRAHERMPEDLPEPLQPVEPVTAPYHRVGEDDERAADPQVTRLLGGAPNDRHGRDRLQRDQRTDCEDDRAHVPLPPMLVEIALHNASPCALSVARLAGGNCGSCWYVITPAITIASTTAPITIVYCSCLN